MHTYRVYGVVIGAQDPFVSPLPRTADDVDVEFVCQGAAPVDVHWGDAHVVDAQGPHDDGTSDFVFAGVAGYDIVRIRGAADFYLTADRIVCHLFEEAHRFLVEIVLFGLVLALWLEQRGVATLHASAVVVDGVAVGFTAPSGAGKSSLAAACVGGGHALLSDDLLALDERAGRCVAQPGYPMMRLWPEQARRFVGPSWDALPRVRPDVDKRRIPVGPGGFGRFEERPSTLHCVYVPQRTPDLDTPVTIVPLTPQEAVMTLVRESFLPREVQRYGLQPARLALFARLTASVPVARLIYPHGFDRLGAAVRAIERDVARTS